MDWMIGKVTVSCLFRRKAFVFCWIFSGCMKLEGNCLEDFDNVRRERSTTGCGG